MVHHVREARVCFRLGSIAVAHVPARTSCGPACSLAQGQAHEPLARTRGPTEPSAPPPRVTRRPSGIRQPVHDDIRQPVHDDPRYPLVSFRSLLDVAWPGRRGIIGGGKRTFAASQCFDLIHVCLLLQPHVVMSCGSTCIAWLATPKFLCARTTWPTGFCFVAKCWHSIG